MTNSQVIALRCAAAIDQRTLAHKHIDEHKDYYARRFKLSEKQRRKLTEFFLEQLNHCPTDLARRILVGVK